MDETRRKRILLTLAAMLSVLLVGDRIVRPAVSRALSQTDARIAELQAALAQGPPDDVTLPERRLREARPYLGMTDARQRLYLESLIGQHLIRSTVPRPPMSLGDGWPGKQVVTYQLTLKRMSLAELRQVLAALDGDPLPMRIDHLRLTPSAEGDRMLNVTLIVSVPADPALADPSAPPLLPSSPATRPSDAGVAMKDIFFPLAAAQSSAPEALVRPFTIVGFKGTGRDARVLLHLQDPEETLWLTAGMVVGGATLAEIRPDAAVFQLGTSTTALTLGQTSGRVGLGRRSFRTHCRIVATVEEDDQLLVLARFPNRAGYVYLAVGDALPNGRIVSIEPDAIVLEYAGYEEVVTVGQDSDSSIPPWTMME
ncbi:MAG: hypothetical protein GX591_09280 [Planctomycetes bacterium]|nr:hypothetical protein [Planctomycetota bacterium]